MSLDPAIFRALVEQGATPEMLLAVVEAAAAVDAAKAEKRRADTAARVRKHRAGNAGNASNALHSVTDVTPPNDIYSNPPEPSGAKAPAIPFSEKVVSVYNEMAGQNGLAIARPLNPGRRKHLTARVREHGEPAVFEAIEKLGRSDWHCGRKAGSDWKADLGWLLKSPENFQKILERDASASANPAKPMNEADRAAYLLKLNDNPMFAATRQAPAIVPRTGNTGPPRAIGDLVQIAGASR